MHLSLKPVDMIAGLVERGADLVSKRIDFGKLGQQRQQVLYSQAAPALVQQLKCAMRFLVEPQQVSSYA